MAQDTICNGFLSFPTDEVNTDYFLNFIQQEDLMREPTINYVDVKTKRTKSEKGIKKSRSYNCPHCPAVLCNASNLQSHIRTHTGEKPFKCNKCSFSFNQSSNLKSHMRTHTGEKPYVCTVCDKSFARSSHLNGHTKMHTGEMPYECDICTKKFYTSTRLKKHKREKHQDGSVFPCGVCEQSFVNESALHVHLKLHNGDRPFKCIICSAAFRSKEDLNIHIKLHLGPSHKYECPRCGQKFQIKLCCEKHYAKCIANIKDLFEDSVDNKIEILSYPLDANVASRELVINARDELLSDSDDNLDDDHLSFPDLQQFITQVNSEEFDMTFKQEPDNELTVSLLQVADDSNFLFQAL